MSSPRETAGSGSRTKYQVHRLCLLDFTEATSLGMVMKNSVDTDGLPPKEVILHAAYAEEARLSEEIRDGLEREKRLRKLGYVALGVTLVVLAIASIVHYW